MPPPGPGNLRDPLTTFNYGIEIAGVVTAQFTECTGLQVSMEVFEYKEGGLNNRTLKFPGRTTFGNVTLKQGMTDNMDLWKWYSKIMDGLSAAPGVGAAKKDVSIVEYSQDHKQQRRWDLHKAYPVKWVGASLNTGQSQVAIESIEIAYEYFEAKGTG
jgi:phage tail-like protein